MEVIKRRRHHNNNGLRGIKTGKVLRDIEYMAKKLNVPTDIQIIRRKRKNERKNRNNVPSIAGKGDGK